MSTLLDPPPVRNNIAPAVHLRNHMTAMRLSFTWFGIRKALSNEQKASAADAFGAEGGFLSAGKKLLDTRDPLFRAVTAVRHEASSDFRLSSLPYPEPGLRLVRQDDLEGINERMAGYRRQLQEAVARLDDHFHQLKQDARGRLGSLYNPADYPDSLAGEFDVSWDFPSVEPPGYLRQLSPEIYRQECQRVQARFEEAVELAEGAFLDELAKLVSHLSERLSGSDDGRPKVFRDTAVENLTAFFERFRRLNIRSSPELDELVASAQAVVGGTSPQQLRDSHALRQQVAAELSTVQSALDGLLVERPRRAILRRPR